LGTALLLVGRVDEALLRMESARPRLNPNCPLLNSSLGLAWLEKNEPEKAIPCLQRAIAAAPDHPIWRVELARAYHDAGRLDDFSAELGRVAAAGLPQLASVEGLHLYYRELWKSSHRRRAWTFFKRAVKEHPDDILMLNNTAWFLATGPSVGAEPAESLRLAQRVCELAGEAHPGLLDTLAAAQAANGRFDEAVRTAEQALQLAQAGGDAALVGQIAQRLDAYRRGQPWRE
jgi:spermidine synthase